MIFWGNYFFEIDMFLRRVFLKYFKLILKYFKINSFYKKHSFFKISEIKKNILKTSTLTHEGLCFRLRSDVKSTLLKATGCCLAHVSSTWR